MVLKSFLKKTALLLIVYLSTVSGDECTGRGCFTREMFDVLSRFTDDSRFDSQEMWDRMDKCFDRWSTDEIDLWEVSDSYWKGIIDYGVAGGNSDGSDPWEGPGPFMEFNPTPLVLPEDMSMFPSLPPGAVNITVYEPCNSVSNIAYMRTIMGICEHEEDYEWNFETDTVRALVQSVLFMAPGSFLMHASGTSLGGATDIEGIHQMALVAHQGSLQSIPYDPVLYDVHESARNFTGKEATAYACEFIVNDSVDDWLAQVRVLDTKLYEFSFMALVTTLLNLVFSERIATRLTIRLAGVLLEGSALQFILDSYAPRLREAFAENDVKAGLFTRTRIFVSFIGVLIRLLYAFYWQEEVFPGKHLTKRTSNFLGAVGIGPVNRLSNLLTGFDRRNDLDFLRSRHVYPGDRRCNVQQPHSKWHEVSANVLVDVMILSDKTSNVIEGKRFNSHHDIFERYRVSEAFSGFDWSALAPEISPIFESCFTTALDSWPDTEMGAFASCMVSSTHRSGKTQTETDETVALDGCLVDNDCIAFDGLNLDIYLMKQCVGLSGNIFRRRPCSSFVNRPRALLCQLTCRDDDVVCSLRCLRRHAEVSSWVEATLACLDAIYQSDDAQEAVLLQLCLQAPLEGLTPFQSSLVRGFSTMAECSSNSCGDSVTSFLHDLGSMSSCVAICLEATKSDDQDGILSLVLPKSLACTLNCALAA